MNPVKFLVLMLTVTMSAMVFAQVNPVPEPMVFESPEPVDMTPASDAAGH